jgi:hypothetical protein
VKKKLAITAVALAIFVAVAPLTGRPPSEWTHVEPGMSRAEAYSLLGLPDTNNESLKGGVRWRSSAVVGRWEFDVFFQADDSVGAFGKRWRWNWW